MELVIKDQEELSKIVNNIIEDSKKYNLIDRFFHYKIERDELYKSISISNFFKESSKLNTDEFLELHSNEFLNKIDIKIKDLIETIKKSFGITDFSSYVMTGKSKIIDNPFLLGISPYLFDYEDFKTFLKHDIFNSKMGSCAMDFHDVFKNSLDDTLYRLNTNVFLFYNTESVDDDEVLFYDSGDILGLFFDNTFQVWDNFELNMKEDKKKAQFLESEMFKYSIKSKIQINLSFELADKVFKKYFEINFTKERYHKIYPDFKIFLKVLYNKPSMETEIKTIGLEEEEVKKMIGFFSCYKATKTSPNIFNYEVEQLVKLMERISGLPVKTTWEKAHRDNKYKIAKNLEKEINSIIPEKSAVKK
jgi:hypothetical protein